MKPTTKVFYIDENINTEEVEDLFNEGYGILPHEKLLILVKAPEQKIVTPKAK